MKQIAKQVVRQLISENGLSLRDIIKIKNLIPKTPAGVSYWVKEKEIKVNIKIIRERTGNIVKVSCKDCPYEAMQGGMTILEEKDIPKGMLEHKCIKI